ncbi:MAG: hypothetical protein WCS43_15180 [Verrucomicrobiota bacterium]
MTTTSVLSASLFIMVVILYAQTCREVIGDGSGRMVQTIDRQKQAGGAVQATTRDANGRIIGTAISQTHAQRISEHPTP